MKPKSAAAVLGVVILVGGEVVHQHSDTLAPSEHVHVEMRTDPVATTATFLAASGAQGAFDPAAFQNDAFQV